jgi:hypothetical protein
MMTASSRTQLHEDVRKRSGDRIEPQIVDFQKIASEARPLSIIKLGQPRSGFDGRQIFYRGFQSSSFRAVTGLGRTFQFS